MKRRLSTLTTLLLTLCFGVVLPTHDHAAHQVCEIDTPSLEHDHDHHADADDHDSDHDAPTDHHNHKHHCSVCVTFASYAHLTAAPHPLTSLTLLGLSSLPRPPTPYVASPAHSHPGRDPPSLV